MLQQRQQAAQSDHCQRSTSSWMQMQCDGRCHGAEPSGAAWAAPMPPAGPLCPLCSAAVHGWPEITTAFALGALLYQVAQPYIPDFGSHHHDHEHPGPLEKVWPAGVALGGAAAVTWPRRRNHGPGWLTACPGTGS